VPKQLSFDPAPLDPMFFAIFPDADATACTTQLVLHLCSKHRLTGRPIAPERLHVAVLHVGHCADLPQGIIAAAGEAAAPFMMRPFHVARE